MSRRDFIRVYESVPAPSEIIRFIDQVVRCAPPDLRFRYHSWRVAILGRYDVCHVHWPEHLTRDDVAWRRMAKRLLFIIWIARLRITRTPVVRTVHNIEPHLQGNRWETRLLSFLDATVVASVTMSSCSPPRRGVREYVIPHGDYREVLTSPAARRIPGRVLLFGRIQPYKGALELLGAAEDLTRRECEIRIVGEASPELAQQITEQVRKVGRRGATVSTLLRGVSNADMVSEITAADLIVLPYRDSGNGNSGVALVALSLNRPVLAPRSCVMEDLAREAGSDWVQMMDDTISAEAIEIALDNVVAARARDPHGRPALHDRDWPSVADAYARVFRECVADRSG